MSAVLRVLPIVLAVAATVMVSTATPRFYSDNPLAREPESRDRSGVPDNESGVMFELP